MLKDKVIVVEKDNIDEIKFLSKEVVICLEIISSFSADGQYIPPDISQGRMTSEEVNELYIALYSKLLNLSFNNPKKLQKMSYKKLLKIIKPAHPFILGIYRNGTPNNRFKSKRVDKSVTDEFILEQFAIEFKKSIIKGPSYIIDFTKQYYGAENNDSYKI